MLQKELDAAVEGEMARDAEEEAAREAAMEEKDGDSQSPKGLLAWLSPFKSPPRLSPEEEAALDPHDDEFRAEMAAINEARLERLRPPTPEPEKKRFVGL